MSNWDRVFGGTDEVSESDIASAQRRSNGNYARILDKQVRSDPLYRGTKPDALTRLALRNLELDRVAEQNRTTPTGLPYGTTPRPSGVPSDAPRMYAGELTKSAPPELVGNALLAGNLGGLSAAFGALAPLRAGLAVGAGADAVLGAKAGEGDAPAVLSGAGMLGRRALPVALATGAAYASDAEAMPFHSWMKRLGASGLPEKTSLYINPNRSELMRMLKDARETYPTDPTVRLLRDRRNMDIYGVEGSSILHDDMRKHLNLPYQHSPGGQGRTLPELEAALEVLRQQPPAMEFAGGGLVKSGLKMMFPNLGAPLHVVKPKGGAWLNGSVERALSNLRYEAPPIKGATRTAPETYNNGASERVVWKAPDGSVVQVNEGPVGHFTRADTIDNWIDGPLTKYVKTRMASPEDEVRRLADQGVLHFDPQIRGNTAAVGNRKALGYPMLSDATSEAGRRWEDLTDAIPQLASYSDHAYTMGTVRDTPKILGRLGGDFAIANPDAKAYAFNRGRTTQDLGFDHLVDELSSALDPNSGLPRHLQLTPEAVKNLSMEKAVRRVAEINEWRAAQQAAANAELANKASLVREYPHSDAAPNPKGLRWVELNTPSKLPEGYTVKNEGPYGFRVYGPEGKEVSLGSHPSEASAVEAILKNPEGRFAKDLADQLKYEGDTMGHCVGGYCDDVLSGHSRIFSLRDAKGEPHVTVETAPKWNGKMGDESTTDQAILQIKGKQNRAPNPEYLPFVQDFVKNPPHGQPWGDVGDLQNSGLRRTRDALNDLEQKILREKGQEFGDYLSDAEIQALQAQFSSNGGKFASGGSVGVPATGWELLTDPTGSPEENKLSWDIFSGHNDPEQLEAVQ